MANEQKEQLMLCQAAVKAIGRALSDEFEPQQEAPDHIRQLLAQLENESKRGESD
jgi:hypothetical protein